MLSPPFGEGGTKRKRRRGKKKKAHDVNLFASPDNNPVILPGKCVSCLMPLYAAFFMMPKSLLIYLQIYFAEVDNERHKMPFFPNFL